MHRPRILVVGGYGAFGARVAERLAQSPDIDVVIAGRSAERAHAAALSLGKLTGREVGNTTLDTSQVTPQELAALGPRVVINASGPFQGQDYRLARACIAIGCHSIDLADGRAFVTGITALDAAAKAGGVTVISGASTVPGLSSAVVAAYVSRFSQLTSIDIGVSPGNHFNPGVATVASILGYVGQPIAMRIEGQTRTVYGWQGLSRVHIPGLGPRLMGFVEVPDLDLFPQAYPGLRSVRVMAGVEVMPFHLGLWAASWLVRAGIIKDLAAWSQILLNAKSWGSFLGSDTGGMSVSLTGPTPAGGNARLNWHLVAGQGHGPYVPALASVILARKLVHGVAVPTGAMACVGLFTLDEFMAEAGDLGITASDSWLDGLRP